MNTRLLFLILISFSISFSALIAENEFSLYEKIENQSSSEITKPSAALLQNVFNLASKHPVASLDVLHKYDPTGEIGFCFGRSMAVHLIARNQKIASSNVRKLFAIGDLRSSENPEWRFHVTELTLNDKGNWIAIDPIMTPPLGKSTPIPMETWISTVKKTWDKKDKAHFYMVSSDTVIPDLRTVPEPEKETGEKVIEISFNPNEHEGFKKAMVGNQTFYEVSPEAEERYFTKVHEGNSIDAFPFHALNINGQEYNFRSYFTDLLNSFSSVQKQTVALADAQCCMEKVMTPKAVRKNTSNLYSPNVNSWFKK